jgi:hypothetical protein
MLIDNTDTIVNVKYWKDKKNYWFYRIIYNSNSQLLLYMRRLIK